MYTYIFCTEDIRLSNCPTSGYTHGYLFYTLKFCMIILLLIVPALATGSSFSWYVSLTYLIIVDFVCSWAAPYFLIIHNASGSSCIFSFLVLERINNSSNENWFLLTNSEMRRKDFGVKNVHCYWAALALKPRSWQSKEIYACILTMYIHRSINLK